MKKERHWFYDLPYLLIGIIVPSIVAGLVDYGCENYSFQETEASSRETKENKLEKDIKDKVYNSLVPNKKHGINP